MNYSLEESFSNTNFKDQLFHAVDYTSEQSFSNTNFTQAYFSLQKIFKKLTIVKKIFFLSITLLGNLHRYETCWSVNDHLNITFRTGKYGCFSIRGSTIYSWNSIQDLLIKNLSP